MARSTSSKAQLTQSNLVVSTRKNARRPPRLLKPPEITCKRKLSVVKKVSINENEKPPQKSEVAIVKKRKDSSRKVRAKRERTPESSAVKHDIAFSSPTKASKYWNAEESTLEEDGFPFHLIDTTRLSYYLLMLCPPKLIQGRHYLILSIPSDSSYRRTHI